MPNQTVLLGFTIIIILFTLFTACNNPELPLTPAATTDIPAPILSATPANVGKKGVIAFTSMQDGNMEIYLMDADGGNQQRLTNHLAEDYWPTWSPDGAKIAFASDRDGDFEIYTINADGSNLRRLTKENGNDLEPAWSPDGEKIAFMVYQDGKSDVYTMNPDGSARRRLTESDGDNYLPKWSPDGAQIVFVSQRDGNPEIYVMKADGSDQRRLTDNPADDRYPSWSPDGAQISFYSDRDGKRELYVMAASGQNPHPLTDDNAQVWVSDWSPAGSLIAFTSIRDGNREIYIMSIDGSTMQRLTNNNVLDGIPAWRPEVDNPLVSPSTATKAPPSPTPSPSTQPIPSTADLGDSCTQRSDGMTMFYVPAGSFQMGSSSNDPDAGADEFPQHEVRLDSFWIDQTEVSNAQYNLCVASGACRESRYANNTAYNLADQPVVGVAWGDALAYCTWAGKRLPSEAQWEYAAKGQPGYVYPWGDDFDGARVNSCDRNCDELWADQRIDDGYKESAPVGSYPSGASWVGALDMAGNVWEWVWDWCGAYPSSPQVNPLGPQEGICKIIRGGAWASPPAGIRTTYRMIGSTEIRPNIRHPNIGFRCVIEAIKTDKE